MIKEEEEGRRGEGEEKRKEGERRRRKEGGKEARGKGAREEKRERKREGELHSQMYVEIVREFLHNCRSLVHVMVTGLSCNPAPPTFSRSRLRSSSSAARRFLVLSRAEYLASVAASASSDSFSLFCSLRLRREKQDRVETLFTGLWLFVGMRTRLLHDAVLDFLCAKKWGLVLGTEYYSTFTKSIVSM